MDGGATLGVSTSKTSQTLSAEFTYGYVRKSYIHGKRQRPPKCKALSQEIVENDLDLQRPD